MRSQSGPVGVGSRIWGRPKLRGGVLSLQTLNPGALYMLNHGTAGPNRGRGIIGGGEIGAGARLGRDPLGTKFGTDLQPDNLQEV